MRVFYDTEFLERGPNEPIVLVSIGMVAEDGREFYAVNGNLSLGQLSILRNDPWLGPNVYAHLPRGSAPRGSQPPGWWSEGMPAVGKFDYQHETVKSRSRIAVDVANFCNVGLRPDEKAELWAWYADYDHVVLSQLFGRMVDLPAHMPMYTRDLKQTVDMMPFEWCSPPQDDSEHHALADARWVRSAFKDVERTASYDDDGCFRL